MKILKQLIETKDILILIEEDTQTLKGGIIIHEDLIDG